MYKKIIEFFIIAFVVLNFVFFLIHLLPGDPTEKILGPHSTVEEQEILKKELGFDKPLLVQYKNFISNTLKLNFGQSLFKKEKVLFIVKKNLKTTLFLGAFTIFLSTFLGVILGVVSSIYLSSPIDNGIRLLNLLGLGAPVFAIGPALILIFSLWIPLFPVSGAESFRHFLLPSITIAIPLSAILTRIVRLRFLEEKKVPWVNFLRAKGLSENQIRIRLFKVVLGTILSVIAIQMSVVFTGTIVTESIFDIPGLGQQLFNAIENRDYPLIQGIIFFITMIYLLIYYIVNYIQVLIDPRIKNVIAK